MWPNRMFRVFDLMSFEVSSFRRNHSHSHSTPHNLDSHSHWAVDITAWLTTWHNSQLSYHFPITFLSLSYHFPITLSLSYHSVTFVSVHSFTTNSLWTCNMDTLTYVTHISNLSRTYHVRFVSSFRVDPGPHGDPGARFASPHPGEIPTLSSKGSLLASQDARGDRTRQRENVDEHVNVKTRGGAWRYVHSSLHGFSVMFCFVCFVTTCETSKKWLRYNFATKEQSFGDFQFGFNKNL